MNPGLLGSVGRSGGATDPTLDGGDDFLARGQHVPVLPGDIPPVHLDGELTPLPVHDLDLGILLVPQLRRDRVGKLADLVSDRATPNGDLLHDCLP